MDLPVDVMRQHIPSSGVGAVSRWALQLCDEVERLERKWDHLNNKARRRAREAELRGNRLAAAERAVMAAGYILCEYVPSTEREAEELRRFEAALQAMGVLLPPELADEQGG